MKILVVHNHYLERGGEDEVVDAEIKLLEERGHQVVIYEKSNEEVNRRSLAKRIFFSLFEMGFSKSVYSQVREIVRRERPDIAHIHNIFFLITPSVYYALKDANVPIVQTLHNYRFFCLRGTFFNKGKVCEKCKGMKLLEGILKGCWRNSRIFSCLLAKLLYGSGAFIGKIDSFIALSKFSRDKFMELGLEGKSIYLKPNFLALQATEGRDYNYALFVGRLVDYKGVNTLINALGIGPSFNLKIVGDGPLRQNVRSLVSSNKNIEWLGKLPRNLVFEKIKNSSFLIFASECYENMPLAIIEGFAFSKPVLASNLGAVRELVIDGVNGILFEPGNAKDLAEKAAYLFTHKTERLEMGKNANKFYQSRFNIEDNYKELLGIYERTIKLKGVK